MFERKKAPVFTGAFLLARIKNTPLVGCFIYAGNLRQPRMTGPALQRLVRLPVDHAGGVVEQALGRRLQEGFQLLLELRLIG